MLAGNPQYSDMELISTILVGSGGASLLTFSNIQQTYKHLQVRFTGRSTLNAEYDNLSFYFNNDTASNYSTHSLFGTGPSVSSNAFTSSVRIYLPSQLAAGTYTSNSFSGGVIDILDYASTTKNKTTKTLHGGSTSGTSMISLASGNWRSTSAITQISFETSGNIAANSRFSLYGIKG
jgi:hypothetical protein